MTRILELAPSLADRFYQEGIGHEEEGALDAAVQAFRRAVQTDNTHVNARLALAYHCRRLDRLEEAIAHCEVVLESNPCAAAYFALGHLLIVKQEYPAALQALQRCLEMDPAYDQARCQVALVYYLQGEYDVAITEFHRAAQQQADWETFFFLGESYRMARRPQEAEHTFRRALSTASNWGQIELTRAQLSACHRLAEFPPDHRLTIKDRTYCDCGVIYLGSSMDDGIAIPPYLFYHFDYSDVARTLRRFIDLSEANGWRWGAASPVDIVSLPLALALSMYYNIGTEPIPDQPTLVVQAIGETVEGLQDAIERLDRPRSFCLLSCWAEEWRPDIVGVATPFVGSLPWYRPSTFNLLHEELSEGQRSPPSSQPWQDPRSPEEIAEEILDALYATEAESNRTEQIAYYERHSRLRW